MKLSTHAKGTLICLLAILILTPDSLLIRKLSNVPNFAVLFYRYLIFSISLLVFMLCTCGLQETIAKFRRIGYLGLFAGIVWGFGNIFITYGLQTIAAADVLVINASNPMFSAVFSYFVLKELIPWYTILAAVACFAAIAGMFYTQLSGGSDDRTVIGFLCSLGAAISMGLYFVLLRLMEKRSNDSEVDSMPCNIIAGALASFVGICVSQDLQVTNGMDWLYLLINGILVLAISFSLLNFGPSMISAPEVSLYTLIETVLGPVWVYLGGYEAPPSTAVYGGSALIAALAIHSIVALRYEQQKDSINSSNRKVELRVADEGAVNEVAYNAMLDNANL